MIDTDDESELTSMCVTFRHDFMLLSAQERSAIVKWMRPIYEHHVKPLRATKQQPPQGKTVRVKVAVAVDFHGRWNAAGWGDCTDMQAVSRAFSNNVRNDGSTYWLTADLPIPEDTVVEAEVE